MRKVSIERIEPAPTGGDDERRGLSDPLDTADVAINHYRLGPGERIAGLHAHVDQEEVFVVLDGEATFETLVNDEIASTDGEVAVGAGEAVRFAPGEFQSCKNDSGGEVALLALGAPKGTEDWRVPLACPECDHDDLRPTVADETPVLVCPDCGAEQAVECSACGSANKRVVLADDGETPLDVCLDCGAESVAR